MDEGGQGARGVRLMTMHAAKGLEYELVFIPGGLAGLGYSDWRRLGWLCIWVGGLHQAMAGV